MFDRFLAYISPLLYSPLTLVECFILLGYVMYHAPHRRPRILAPWLLLVLFSVFAINGGEPMRAVWPTPSGEFITHPFALKPRAVVPNTMVVRVRAIGLNPHDDRALHAFPILPFARWWLPFTVAQEYSGVVADSGCPQRFKPGDQVLGIAPLGALADYALVTCSEAARMPSGLSFELAAALPVSFSTSARALRGSLSENKAVFVTQATDNQFGTAAVLIARLLGARAIHCDAPATRAAYARRLGCTDVLDIASAQNESAVKERIAGLTGKVDVVFDPSPSLELSQRYFHALVNTIKFHNSDGKYQVLKGSAKDWFVKILYQLTGHDHIFLCDILGHEHYNVFRNVVFWTPILSSTDWQTIEAMPLEWVNSIDIQVLENPFMPQNVGKAYHAFHNGNVTKKMVFKIPPK